MNDIIHEDEKSLETQNEDLEKEDLYKLPDEVSEKEILESIKVEEEPTSKDLKPLELKGKTEEEQAKELYVEFSAYLENKTDIKPDLGVKVTIPTGIDVFDAILGGGFAIGSLNIIVGQPGSGKTMLAIQAMGNGQKVYKGKLITAFLDSEEATTSIRLSNLGVRYPRITPYSDMTVEKVFKFIEGVCLFKQEKKLMDIPSVIIWDSIANTLSQKEREAEDINSVIGYKARMLSILIPKYVAKCAKFNISLIAVNQLRDILQIGQFSLPKELKFMTTGKDMPGGNVLRFNAFQLVELKTKSILLKEKYGFDGILVSAKTVKNKLFSPNVTVNLAGDFRTGFSNFWTSYQFLTETKRLHADPWNFLVSLPDKKFRTKDALTLYNSDSKFKEFFDQAVQEAIKVDIIEKYNMEVE